MADRSIRGRFVWNDLMTPDTAGAHAFYSKALGWRSQVWDQDPSYTMFVGPNGPLGGSVETPSGAPQWLPYISVEDVAQTVEHARSLGAQVVKDANTLPNGGAYAVLADPQGAQFGVYSSTSEYGPEQAPKRGEFSWYELASSDYKTAFEFYSNLFGWERVTEHDMGPMGVYVIFGRDGQQKGGIYTKPAEMKGKPMWIGYVRVKDIEQVVRKVKSSRGTLINGPMEVPGGDWVAQFSDPYGAMFAVHVAKADVKAPGAAPPREQEETAAAPPAEEAAAERSAPARRPAKRATKRPAKTSAKTATRAKPAAKRGGRKATKKKAPARSGAKKAPARGGAKKKASKKAPAKKRTAAKVAKRPARKRAAAPRGGKKKAARRKK